VSIFFIYIERGESKIFLSKLWKGMSKGMKLKEYDPGGGSI
jgi:hypothetical protein